MSTAEPPLLILDLPRGGPKTKGRGWGALIGNVVLLTVTIPLGLSIRRHGLEVFSGFFLLSGMMALLALASLWGIALFLLYQWISATFGREAILLQSGKLTWQRTLFGRESRRSIQLNGKSRAELIELFQSNGPVYRIEISGVDGRLAFGEVLSEQQQNDAVDRINDYLDRVETIAAARTIGGHEAIRPEVAHTQVYSFDTVLHVEESSAVRLCCWYEPTPDVMNRWVIPGVMFVLGFLSLTWPVASMARTLESPWGDRIVPLLILIPSLAIGPFFLIGGCFARWGRVTIELTPQSLSRRWQIGKWKWTRSLPTGQLTSLEVEFEDGTRSRPRETDLNPRVNPTRTANSSALNCAARAGRQKLTLTTFVNDEGFCRQLAGLLQRKLAAMGHVLPDR